MVDRFADELASGVDVVESGIVQQVTPEDVVAGIATRSYVAVMDDAAPARPSSAGIRELLATHPDTRGRDVLELPYVTRAYRLTRR